PREVPARGEEDHHVEDAEEDRDAERGAADLPRGVEALPRRDGGHQRARAEVARSDADARHAARPAGDAEREARSALLRGHARLSAITGLTAVTGLTGHTGL